jgi:hypothetical protein
VANLLAIIRLLLDGLLFLLVLLSLLPPLLLLIRIIGWRNLQDFLDNQIVVLVKLLLLLLEGSQFPEDGVE